MEEEAPIVSTDGTLGPPMRARAGLSAFLVLSLIAGCKRVPSSHHDEPAVEEKTTECPLHPDYCRGRCKDLDSRRSSQHADRLSASARPRFGTCGDFVVFEEKEPATDAGIREYFDDAGDIVGAIDDRRVTECPTFGLVPTCTPAWRDYPRASIALSITSAPPAFDRSSIALELHPTRSEIGTCYRTALWDDPTIRGTIEVVGDLPPDAGAAKWRAGETKLVGSSPALVACTLSAFTRLRHATATKNAELRLLVELTPKPAQTEAP